MNTIFSLGAKNIQLLCSAAAILLDPPSFQEHYVTFDLKKSHGIDADFFLRSQSVGITCKGEDIRLFYLLQDMIKANELEFSVQCDGQQKPFVPYLAGEGQYSMDSPCTYYLAGITSGNLKGWSDLSISRDPATFSARADFLSMLLFKQWIYRMMPIIEQYKRYKRLNLLAPIERVLLEAEKPKDGFALAA